VLSELRIHERQASVCCNHLFCREPSSTPRRWVHGVLETLPLCDRPATVAPATRRSWLPPGSSVGVLSRCLPPLRRAHPRHETVHDGLVHCLRSTRSLDTTAPFRAVTGRSHSDREAITALAPACSRLVALRSRTHLANVCHSAGVASAHSCDRRPKCAWTGGLSAAASPPCLVCACDFLARVCHPSPITHHPAPPRPARSRLRP
jgi:hypothetical protein